MKRFLIILFVLSVTMFPEAFSQQPIVKSIEKIKLEVSDIKWVYLKFPAKVKYADMGTDDIVVEKCYYDNFLRIKSVVPVFDATSVTVISLDGKVYTFTLEYDQNPDYLAVDMQNVTNKISDTNAIQPRRIELSRYRTSHIILDVKVVDISTGVDSIIAEPAEDINNIVKARQMSAFDGFSETSLTIITEDKEIYPLLITSNDNPQNLNVSITSSHSPLAKFTEFSMNEIQMEKNGKMVVDCGARINNIGVYENKMTFCLISLYIKDDVLMFHLYAKNGSKIDYDIDFIRCYVKNQKTSKSSTSQDDERIPLYVYKTNENDRIPAGGTFSTVFFFKRFTVPDKHLFYFEMFEKNGGRHIKFTASNKEILKAENLPDDLALNNIE